MKTLALAILLVTAPVAAGAEGVTLRVSIFGGPFSESTQRYAVDRFTLETGNKVEFTYGQPSDFLAKMIASRGRPPPFDVLILDDDVQSAAIKAGVLQPMDPAIVTNLKHLYPIGVAGDNMGAAMFFFSFGIAFNTQKLAAAGIPAPQHWSDLWDPRYAGHIAIPDISQVMGRDFLVEIARLNGGSEDDITPAFAKIKQIKVQSYYTASQTLVSQFEAGDVWIAPWLNIRAYNLANRGLPVDFVIPSEGSVGGMDTIAVAKGTPNPKEAMMFVNYVLSPIAELGMAHTMPSGPSNALLTPVLQADPKMSAQAPVTPDDLKKLYLPDWPKFMAKFPQWAAAWNRQVLQ